MLLQLIVLSDLENDFTNPHDASASLNKWAVSSWQPPHPWYFKMAPIALLQYPFEWHIFPTCLKNILVCCFMPLSWKSTYKALWHCWHVRTIAESKTSLLAQVPEFVIQTAMMSFLLLCGKWVTGMNFPSMELLHPLCTACLCWCCLIFKYLAPPAIYSTELMKHIRIQTSRWNKDLPVWNAKAAQQVLQFYCIEGGIHVAMTIYNWREYLRGDHRVDATDVFQKVNFQKHVRIGKLIFYLISFVILIYKWVFSTTWPPPRQASHIGFSQDIKWLRIRAFFYARQYSRIQISWGCIK